MLTQSARKALTGTMLAATIFSGSSAILLATSSPAGAQAYTYQGHNGQYGNVTFFGAPPTTLPSHNGQYGNVTFLGGVQPYTYPGHSGQYGNLTYFGVQPAGTVPVRTVSAGTVPVRTVPVPGLVPVRASGRR